MPAVEQRSLVAAHLWCILSKLQGLEFGYVYYCESGPALGDFSSLNNRLLLPWIDAVLGADDPVMLENENKQPTEAPRFHKMNTFATKRLTSRRKTAAFSPKNRSETVRKLSDVTPKIELEEGEI